MNSRLARRARIRLRARMSTLVIRPWPTLMLPWMLTKKLKNLSLVGEEAAVIEGRAARALLLEAAPLSSVPKAAHPLSRLSCGQESGGEEFKGENQPLLFVDINLGGSEQQRIVVYEGDTAEELAVNFCVEHNLDEETQEKL